MPSRRKGETVEEFRVRNAAYTKAYNKAHPEKRKAHYVAHQEQIKAYRRTYRATNREKVLSQAKVNNLRREYGLAPNDYQTMLNNQNGRCAICETTTPGGKGSFHVDHCHGSGKIRGLLCHSCNTGLGQSQDSPALLLKMALYVEQHRETAHEISFPFTPKIWEGATKQELERHKNLKRKYHISHHQYNRMADEQGFRCYLCDTPETPINRPCVDHNHSTGAVRRLLCHGCNTALGLFKDNPDLLRKATDYLMEHQADASLLSTVVSPVPPSVSS